MKCEFSDGTFWTVTNENDLESRLYQVGVGEHVILSDGEQFIQVRRNFESVDVQWSDGTTLCECQDDLNFAHAVPLFVAFYRKEPELRSLVKWRTLGNRSAGREGARADSRRSGGWSWTAAEDAEFERDPAQFLKNKAKGYLKRKLKDFLG